MLQATLPEIKLALSSKSRDLLSHVISECLQMRGRNSVWTCFAFDLEDDAVRLFWIKILQEM